MRLALRDRGMGLGGWEGGGVGTYKREERNGEKETGIEITGKELDLAETQKNRDCGDRKTERERSKERE